MRMEKDITWLENTGLDIQTGIGYTGGQDKYISAIKRFYSNYGKNRESIENYKAAEDYENYMIKVHALKSNSKMIGAGELGKLFEVLENAARTGDVSKIDADTDNVLAMYEALVSRLKPVEEMGDVRAADEISGDVARETAEKLLGALDDFDDDLSKELIKKLSGYPFRITQKNRLKEASNLVDDFMYEEAAEIINEIIPAIE